MQGLEAAANTLQSLQARTVSQESRFASVDRDISTLRRDVELLLGLVRDGNGRASLLQRVQGLEILLGELQRQLTRLETQLSSRRIFDNGGTSTKGQMATKDAAMLIAALLGGLTGLISAIITAMKS